MPRGKSYNLQMKEGTQNTDKKEDLVRMGKKRNFLFFQSEGLLLPSTQSHGIEQDGWSAHGKHDSYLFNTQHILALQQCHSVITLPVYICPFNHSIASSTVLIPR